MASYSCCLSNLSLKLVSIYLSVVSIPASLIKGEDEAVIVVALVEIVIFSVYLYHVLMEEDIVSNNYYVGIVECYEISFEYQRLVEYCCDFR